jgi:hypothetical protein
MAIKYYNVENPNVLVILNVPTAPWSSANLSFISFNSYNFTWNFEGMTEQYTKWRGEHAAAQAKIKKDAGGGGLNPGTYEARIMDNDNTDCTSVSFMFTFIVE